MTRLALDAHFVHDALAIDLLGPERAGAAEEEASRRRGLPSAREWVLSQHVARMLGEQGVKELARLVLHDAVAVGQVVGIQQAFYFRREPKRYSAGNRPIYFHAKLNTDTSILVDGRLNSARCMTASGPDNMSGRAGVFILAIVVEAAPKHIRLRPILVGQRFFVDDEHMFRSLGMGGSREVSPMRIDQFGTANFKRAATKAQLDSVLRMPEREIKRALATLIGEPYIHKDWGGETSDLFSANLLLDGDLVSSAWLLKGGPGHPRAMTVKALGKNGDQIDRLFKEPADLLVLQHAGEILPPVRNMMATYAYDMRSPRRYMILDGAHTARLMTAYRKRPKRAGRPANS